MQHDTGADHPECAARLAAVSDRLLASGLSDVLTNFDAPEATREELLRVHDAAYIEALFAKAPSSGLRRRTVSQTVSSCSIQPSSSSVTP